MDNRAGCAIMILIAIVALLLLVYSQPDVCANVIGQLNALGISCERKGTYLVTITDCGCPCAEAQICDWQMALGCISQSVLTPPPAGSCVWTIEYTIPE